MDAPLCNALSQELVICSLVHVPFCPTAFASLHKTVPNAALLGALAVKSTLFLHHTFGIWCSVSGPKQQINHMAGSSLGLTPELLVNSSCHLAASGALTAGGAQVSAHCHYGMESL